MTEILCLIKTNITSTLLEMKYLFAYFSINQVISKLTKQALYPQNLGTHKIMSHIFFFQFNDQINILPIQKTTKYLRFLKKNSFQYISNYFAININE